MLTCLLRFCIVFRGQKVKTVSNVPAFFVNINIDCDHLYIVAHISDSRVWPRPSAAPVHGSFLLSSALAPSTRTASGAGKPPPPAVCSGMPNWRRDPCGRQGGPENTERLDGSGRVGANGAPARRATVANVCSRCLFYRQTSGERMQPSGGPGSIRARQSSCGEEWAGRGGRPS